MILESDIWISLWDNQMKLYNSTIMSIRYKLPSSGKSISSHELSNNSILNVSQHIKYHIYRNIWSILSDKHVLYN